MDALTGNFSKVETKSLSYFYDDHQVLYAVSFSIPDKKVTAVIGPSGCGKSTLIKSVNRIGEITSQIKVEGEVLFNGENIYRPGLDVVELRRRIGMVFQKPNPFPKSIYENVAFGLRIHGITGKEQLDSIVEQSLRQAALWDEVKDRLSESAFELSGGQQQRLCIARALTLDPEVILMDEPCSALDPTGTAKIEDTIQVLKSDYCILIVTHNMQQAARVSDYTAFLNLGRLIEHDLTTNIFTNPKNKLTEDYITGRFG
jgi:phosphate transport system ATP-binding protein